MAVFQPAVKKEVKKVAIYTGVGVVLMWIILAALRPMMPDKIVFDYTIFLGGIAGALVAIANFALMGLTVQNIAATEDEELARNKMKMSYTQRLALQIVWIIIAFVAPCFNVIAGILPLLFPSFGIKLMSVLNK